MGSERKGVWMQTATGRQFWPLDPRAEEVYIEDIAHALSNLCRFNGHVRDFYSVAQHSVLVSQWCPPEYALWGLLHDAAEAYIGDMINPLKHGSGELGQLFERAEEKILFAVAERFGLTEWPRPRAVQDVDRWLLAAEGRDLMRNAEWVGAVRKLVVPPLPTVPEIVPRDPGAARYEFLIRFYQLREEQAR